MSQPNTKVNFDARLLRPITPDSEASWAFLVLPKAASEMLPRRGRTSVDGTINGSGFSATLEPDGQLSHWLRVSEALRLAAGANVGDLVAIELVPVEHEPEPEVPQDLSEALEANPQALAVWNSTTTVARLDWIHWVTSAKQAKTRKQRISNGCDMLASGKRRVCCFDPSGFYSKAFSAPDSADKLHLS